MGNCQIVCDAELNAGPHWHIPADRVSAISTNTDGQILQFVVTDIPASFFDSRSIPPSRGVIFRLLQAHLSALYPGIHLHNEDLSISPAS